MNGQPRSVSATLALILLNILIWFAFGTIVAANIHPALHISLLIRGIMAFLAFAIAGTLLTLFIFLNKQNRLAYFLTLGLLIAASIVTIFDDFGWVDLVFLIVNIAPITLLIKDRAWYLQSRSGSFGDQEVT